MERIFNNILTTKNQEQIHLGHCHRTMILRLIACWKASGRQYSAGSNEIEKVNRKLTNYLHYFSLFIIHFLYFTFCFWIFYFPTIWTYFFGGGCVLGTRFLAGMTGNVSGRTARLWQTAGSWQKVTMTRAKKNGISIFFWLEIYHARSPSLPHRLAAVATFSSAANGSHKKPHTKPNQRKKSLFREPQTKANSGKSLAYKFPINFSCKTQELCRYPHHPPIITTHTHTHISGGGLKCSIAITWLINISSKNWKTLSEA